MSLPNSDSRMQCSLCQLDYFKIYFIVASALKVKELLGCLYVYGHLNTVNKL